ncbi:MAG: DUF1178 family protein [Burkholderiales bacterium]|nr:DUF1178 family protein [Burkholderiales bacterium]
MQNHVFEGWFASGEEFERQQAAKLVRCPVCDDWHVERRPSARVHVRKGGEVAEPSEPPSEAVSGMPVDLVAKLREIVRKTEDVGERFPEEARKIHYDEAPKRAIRGKATKEDAQALTDEGIEFTPLPPFLSGDSH